MRRISASILLLLTLLLALPAPARADWLWNLFVQADIYEKAGQIDQAIPLWLQMAEAYGQNGDATNAAIFWKKLGKAYDERGMRNEAIAAYEQEAHYWALAGHADWGKVDLIRADQLRTTVKLYLDQPAPSLNRPLAKHEPANGALLGAYTELDPAVRADWTRADDVYGRPLAAALIYWTYGQSNIETYIQHAQRAGIGLQIALQPLNGLDVVKDDAYLRGFARKLKESGLPIFLRFAGEMNGEWVPWHVEPQRYIEKFRLVSRVMREEAPNVAMLWAPGYIPENYDAYYPGDEWTDWVGISMYLDWFASGDPNQPADRDSPLDMVKGIHQRYAARKPIMIAEWGVANREYTTGGQHTDWAIANLQRYYAGLPRLYPGVKAVFYFSVDQMATPNPHTTAVWSNYLLSGKPDLLAAYRQATADPYYLSQVGTSAPTGYREFTAAGDRVDPGTYRLSAAVKLYDPIVSRVEYLVDGRMVGSATKAPYEVAHDFAPYDGRKVTVTVKAYNSQGHLEGDSAYAVQVGLSDLEGHWAKDRIRRLVARKVVTGYPDGTFRPEDPISRGAFFKLLAGALGASESAPATFADLPVSHWAYPSASALVARGILRVDEYPGARLSPDQSISREEMAVLVARVAGLTASTPPVFVDSGSIRAEWRASVGAAVAANLLTGFPDNSFKPQEGANRAQAAVVIIRLLDQMK